MFRLFFIVTSALLMTMLSGCKEDKSEFPHIPTRNEMLQIKRKKYGGADVEDVRNAIQILDNDVQKLQQRIEILEAENTVLKHYFSERK